ncbi:MAG: LamG-like jellyroll fold domain-containing protein [Bacteroidota bacterium]
MKKAAVISSLCFLLLIGILPACLANNITVSAISLTNRNTSTQTVRVNFDLSWDNSWRTTSAPFNWDAAWVFVKYRVGTTGEWKHATLDASGHTLPGIAAATQTDATGIFIYRSAAVGSPATFNPTGIQLQWKYGSDGVADEARIFVRVFAIEMVYNQVGGFQAGSGGHTTGELRTANDVLASGTASTFTITGSLPTVQGNSSSSSPTNIAARFNGSNDISGTTTASLAAGYPTGFNAFYSMKYEISQQQYVDFLNTLTYTQQAARTATAPNSTAGTGALINPNDKRNGIDIQTPGTASTVPAVYACNLDDDGSYNEADDGQHIACNYLSWDDLTAYLDWAALRPMTELEFEKSCRGNQNPTPSEYAWGNTSATALSGLTNANTMSETASNTSANIAFTNAFNTGPLRNGIFATSSTGRATSGSGYYGNMELSGNLWERVVTVGNATGRTFSGVHGNGALTTGGASDVSGWPAAAGNGWKGGSWLNTTTNSATTSDRAQAANTDNTRAADAGGRGVRTISSGIVTDGLVLWLDAGNTPSYPGSGTAWTDLSGNRNNGTLTNGPTYSSTNGGVVVFDGVNDFIELGTPSSLQFASGSSFTINMWFRTNNAVSSQALFSYGNNAYNLYIDGSKLWFAKARVANDLGGPSISSNIWYNITLINNIGTNTIYYLNGILQNTKSFGSTYTYANPLRIGTSFDEGYFFNGNIALTKVYNRSLTQTEITQNFNAQKARFGL